MEWKYLKEADVPLVGCFAIDTENRFTAGIDNNSEEKNIKKSRALLPEHKHISHFQNGRRFQRSNTSEVCEQEEAAAELMLKMLTGRFMEHLQMG